MDFKVPSTPTHPMILEKPNLSLRCVSRALISDLSPFSFLPLCRHGHVHTPYISPSMRFMPHYQDVWFLNSVEKGRYTHLVCFEKRKKKAKVRLNKEILKKSQLLQIYKYLYSVWRCKTKEYLYKQYTNYTWTRNGKKSMNESHIRHDSLKRDSGVTCKKDSE